MQTIKYVINNFFSIYKNFVLYQTSSNTLTIYDFLTSTEIIHKVNYIPRMSLGEYVLFKDPENKDIWNYYVMSIKNYLNNLYLCMEDILKLEKKRTDDICVEQIIHKIYDNFDVSNTSHTSEVKFTLCERIHSDALYMSIYRGDSLDQQDNIKQLGLMPLQESSYCIYKDTIYMQEMSDDLIICDKKNNYKICHGITNIKNIQHMGNWQGKLVEFNYYVGALCVFDVDVTYNVTNDTHILS
jgi:hypothetical protein